MLDSQSAAAKVNKQNFKRTLTLVFVDGHLRAGRNLGHQRSRNAYFLDKYTAGKTVNMDMRPHD